MNLIGIAGSAGAGKDSIADRLVSHHGYVRISFADELKRFTRDVFALTDDQVFGCIDDKNRIDPRYHLAPAWDAAFDRLARSGPAWCRRLFGDHKGKAYLRLIKWFEGLEFQYGCRALHPGFSPRVALQTIGTEYGRSIDGQVWVRTTLETAKRLLEGPGLTYYRDIGLTDAAGKPPVGVVIPDARFWNEIEAVKDAGGVVVRVVRPGFDGDVGVQGHRSEAEQRGIPDSAFDAVIHNRGSLEDLGRAVDEFISALGARSAA